MIKIILICFGVSAAILFIMGTVLIYTSKNELDLMVAFKCVAFSVLYASIFSFIDRRIIVLSLTYTGISIVFLIIIFIGEKKTIERYNKTSHIENIKYDFCTDNNSPVSCSDGCNRTILLHKFTTQFQNHMGTS